MTFPASEWLVLTRNFVAGSHPQNDNNIRNETENIPTTIPERGLDRIIRVGYWINANNPIGASTAVMNNIFYTASVGYGPGSNGESIRPTRTSAFRRAPVKLYATRVKVPSVELDCSRPKAASGKKPRGGTRKHDAD